MLVLEHCCRSGGRVLDKGCGVTLIVGSTIVLILRVRIIVGHGWCVGLLCVCGRGLGRLRSRWRDDRRGRLRVLVLGSRKPLHIIMPQDIAISTKRWRLRIRIVKALALVVAIVFAATKATEVAALRLVLLMLRPKLSEGTHATTHACAVILLLRGSWRIEVRCILAEVGRRLGLHLLGRAVLLWL